MTQSSGERLFETYWLKMLGGPTFDAEYRFHPRRRWRFDFAWPSVKIAVEIDGGAYTRGRHTRGKGFEADCEKMNAAALLGWRVLRFTPQMLERDPFAQLEPLRQEIEALIKGEITRDQPEGADADRRTAR